MTSSTEKKLKEKVKKLKENFNKCETARKEVISQFHTNKETIKTLSKQVKKMYEENVKLKAYILKKSLKRWGNTLD